MWKRKSLKEIERQIAQTLREEREVIFAYLYGSFLEKDNFRDIDLALYLKRNSIITAVNLQTKLSRILGLPPDILDVRLLNGILKHPDAFTLLYLERIFKEGKLIVNKDPKLLADFLEKYSNKYRESEFLLAEVK